MDIKIIETGKIVKLNLVDSVSGVDWISDMIGNHDDLRYDIEEDVYIMSQEQFDFWDNLTEEYGAADERISALKEKLFGYEYENFISRLGDVNADLEDQPRLFNAICDEFEERM